MKAIREGDLYFLESPFHDKGGDTEKEKRLSYLLGTVSSRPAVVVRAPTWWDPFNTVTVIPALSKGHPAITCHMYDRYGRLTQADYPFVPHNPHTIPISRLGRYIGSMDDDELEELLYAFHWIHDPYMQRDRNCKVPNIYKTLLKRKTPYTSWKTNKDARSNVSICLDKSKMESRTHPELDGLDVSYPLNLNLPADTDIALQGEIGFQATEEPLPDAVTDTTKEVVSVEKSFPPSIFSEDVLHRVAGRFNISDVYYNNMAVRNPDVITGDEKAQINRDTLNRPIFEDILAYYKTFQPLDAFLLGPRLPTKVLAEISGHTGNEAAVLKRLCNFMRDMSEDEYQKRIVDLGLNRVEVNDLGKNDLGTNETFVKGQNGSNGTAVDPAILIKLKPYMNQKKVDKLPKNLVQVFLDTPKYAIRKIWAGPNFAAAYGKAYAGYSK